MAKKQTKLNVEPRTIFCRDNLDILQGINSECIDLIYLDPPFNKKKVFSAPMGSSAEGAEFRDIFRKEDVKDEWVKSIEGKDEDLHAFLSGVKEYSSTYNYCYLVYMTIRLIECRRILKDTGSLYLHCDTTMSHYLKIVMDCVFGERNFKNEIIWKRTSSHNDPKRFGRNADSILFYTKTAKYFFEPVHLEYDEKYIADFFRYKDERGQYRLRDLTGADVTKGESNATWRGYTPSQSGRHWAVPQRIVNRLAGKEKAEKMSIIERLELLDEKGYIVFSRNGIPSVKQHLKDLKGAPAQTIWVDIPPVSPQSKERTDYPTQKPLALLERIVKASSNKGDIVLDPFCGCATTCVAAEKLGRLWIGADVSHRAYTEVKKRIKREVSLPLVDEEPNFSTIPPKRGKDEEQDQGYVYIIGHKREPGRFKVGIAKNPASRLNQYQIGCPDRAYKLLHKQLTPYYKEIEQHIHKKFAADHEWVTGELEAIKKAIKAADKKFRGGGKSAA